MVRDSQLFGLALPESAQTSAPKPDRSNISSYAASLQHENVPVGTLSQIEDKQQDIRRYGERRWMYALAVYDPT